MDIFDRSTSCQSRRKCMYHAQKWNIESRVSLIDYILRIHYERAVVIFSNGIKMFKNEKIDSMIRSLIILDWIVDEKKFHFL